MNKVNGYTIIAHRWSDSTKESYIILAARQDDYSTYEYVTADIQTLESNEWFWGHYFSGVGNLVNAITDFEER